MLRLGKTITEKILSKASGKRKVSPGEYLHGITTPHIIVLGDTSTSHLDILKEDGFPKVWDPKRVIIVMDHSGAGTVSSPRENARINKEFAKQVGIPKNNIFDLGRQGISHQLAVDHGWALPGTVFLSQDTHATMLGAVGCYAVSLGYATAAFLITGETWLLVPESIKINLSGKLQKGVMSRDVSEWILGKIGPAGALNQVMEFTGPIIENMSIDGRLSLCCLTLFSGAITGIVNPDQKTIDHLKRSTSEPFKPLTSDLDAEYAEILEFDLSMVEPQVVVPPKRHTVKPISEVQGKEINRGFIGSCANCRMEDLRIAAKILKGKKVHTDTILTIIPGSVNVLRQALREGLIETFIDAGAVVPAPCCGMCPGRITPLTKKDVCVSTGTCNYPGRMGSMEAKIYATSPASVAASAIEGRLTDPRGYL